MNTQKEVALKSMEVLGIYKPYIDAFDKKGTVCLFEGFGGFYIGEDNEPELLTKIKSFEEETGSLVYAVTHEITEFGELYDFLCVSKYEEDWELPDVLDTKGIHDGKFLSNTKVIAWAYVWNKSYEYCSEYGSIGLTCLGGGIKRIS